jgi:uncharacterized protein (DUF1800 family)
LLVYLDNFQSIGPHSRGAAGGQRRGLNENYARELLELHTLGVHGGYTQQDVQELAKILTGWTLTGFGGPLERLVQGRGMRPGGQRGAAGRLADGQSKDGGAIAFVFQELLHEPGSKTVLGRRYAEAGIAEGERVIRDLCRHESTAQLIATKLVRHFVSDEPPAPAVERVAWAFRSSDGDLKVVARALVDEPDAWREGARKFRTPQDWIVAVFRAFGTRDVRPNVAVLLRQLRQPFWSPPSPKGFGDVMQEWADPDSLLNRAELARSMSRLPGAAALDPRSLLDVVDVQPGESLHRLVGDETISAPERIALAIAGPAFQWR